MTAKEAQKISVSRDKKNGLYLQDRHCLSPCLDSTMFVSLALTDIHFPLFQYTIFPTNNIFILWLEGNTDTTIVLDNFETSRIVLSQSFYCCTLHVVIVTLWRYIFMCVNQTMRRLLVSQSKENSGFICKIGPRVVGYYLFCSCIVEDG